MELGIHVVLFDVDGGPTRLAGELARIGEASENAGVTWLSVMDHFFQLEHIGVAEDAMLESYTTLGYLAAHTRRTRIGLLVVGVTYRHPGVLAKTVTTLDVLSGGRATFGIGAAWYEREHRALGVPFPPLAERFERLEETLRITHQMWDQDNDGPFEGKHFQLAETLCHPAPISQRSTRHHGPEILVGGGGEKKTLRLVAEYADACNLFATTPEEVAHKLDVLRGHCERIDRDPAEIRTTVMARQPLTNADEADEFVTAMADYATLGVDQVIVIPPADAPAAWIDRIVAPMVPRLAELGA